MKSKPKQKPFIEVRYLFWTNFYRTKGEGDIVMYSTYEIAEKDQGYMKKYGHYDVGPIVKVEIPRK